MRNYFDIKNMIIIFALIGSLVFLTAPVFASQVQLIETAYGESSLRHIEAIPDSEDFIAAGYAQAENGKDAIAVRLSKELDGFAVKWTYTYDGPNNDGTNVNEFGKCIISVGPGLYLMGGVADSYSVDESDDTKGKIFLVLLEESSDGASVTPVWEEILYPLSDKGGIRYLKQINENEFVACGQRRDEGLFKTQAAAMKFHLDPDNLGLEIDWSRTYPAATGEDQFLSWFEMIEPCEVGAEQQLFAYGTGYRLINDEKYGGIYLVWIDATSGEVATYNSDLPKKFLLCDPDENGINKSYEGRSLSNEINGRFFMSGFSTPINDNQLGVKDGFIFSIPKNWPLEEMYFYQEYGDEFVPFNFHDYGWFVRAYQIESEIFCVLSGYTVAAHYLGGSRDAWLLCVDETGTPVWRNHYGTLSSDCGNSVCVLPDGSFVVAGFSGENEENDRDLFVFWTNDHFSSAMYYAGSIDLNMSQTTFPRGQMLNIDEISFENLGYGDNFVLYIEVAKQMEGGGFKTFNREFKSTEAIAPLGVPAHFENVKMLTPSQGNYKLKVKARPLNGVEAFAESETVLVEISAP